MMDYERRMNQVFEGDSSLFSGKRIILGIQDGEGIQTMTDPAGAYQAFVVGRELWCLDRQENRAVRVFTFRDGVNENSQGNYKKHGVKILSVSESGDVSFLVYGYMNRDVYKRQAEKGWGDPDTPMDAEAILSRESEKTWSAVRELIRDDASVLDVLFYPNLFHNLKAAIKESVTGKSHGKVYFDDCSIDPKEMLRIIQDRDYLSLPENMRAAAQEAHETFLHTGDGQLCDIIVDRACLEVIYKAGQEADASIIRDYAESTVAVADIKIAVRSQKTAKTLEFMKRALAPCGSLNTDRLACLLYTSCPGTGE